MRSGSLTTLVAAALLAVAAAPAAAQRIDIGHIPQCVEAVPAHVAISSGNPVLLDVRVLVDGDVSVTRAGQVIDAAARAYAPLGIPLAATYEPVGFTGSEAESLIAQAKAHYGGARPAGIDVVYVLTPKNIRAAGSDAVAGLADCIGGVAFADRAFAVGENISPDSSMVDGVLLSGSLSAKILAHEVGHLFGGHHHYANCAEGLLTELGSELSPCTLMFNDVGLASFEFGALNGLVVRGHAEVYAG